MLRREFLKLCGALAAAPALSRFNMSEKTTVLDSTVYYREYLAALRRPTSPRTHKGWPNSCKVKFQGGGDLEVYVEARKHYHAAIEASAVLDLTALSPDAGRLGICLQPGHTWLCRPDAPYGVGNRSNPLVPGRDAAHSSWPFGTAFLWAPPDQVSHLFRPVMYVGDVFGSTQPSNRIDLFIGEPGHAWGKRKIRVKRFLPWSGVSRRPVRGAQEALNRLRFVGKNGKRLREDDSWKTDGETHYALNCFRGSRADSFTFGIPDPFVPWDPEVYHILRRVAQTHGQ